MKVTRFLRLLALLLSMALIPGALAKGDADGYNNRGIAKQAKGDLEGAIADFNRAIELNPRDAQAYNNRGNPKQDKGDLEGAIADYNRAIELDPKYAKAYYNRGLAKQAKGDLDGAIADYNRAIELNPKNAAAYTNRGVAKQAKGDLEGAIADSNRALELDPKLAAAYGNRGVAKEVKGDLEGAIADYNRVIELDPKLAKSYDNLKAVPQRFQVVVIQSLQSILRLNFKSPLEPRLGFGQQPQPAIVAAQVVVEDRHVRQALDGIHQDDPRRLQAVCPSRGKSRTGSLSRSAE